MTSVATALLAFLAMGGVPLYIAGLAAVMFGVYAIMHTDPIGIMTPMVNSIGTFTLVSVPLFLLSGQILASSGAMKPLARLFNSFLGHIPGGPAHALIYACALFGAMTSIPLAAIAGLGPVMVPLMERLGYSKSFSIGLLFCSSLLAQLIPPSIMPIVYGYVAKESIADLWVAGIIPGIVTALLLSGTVIFHVRRGHYEKLPPASWKERWEALKESWPVLLMPVVILGPIYAGIATPAEVSAFAVLYPLFLGFVWYRELKMPALWEACRLTVFVTGVVLIIIVSFMLFNVLLTYARIPFKLGELISGMPGGKMLFMFVMIGVYLIMGAFIDPSAILVITTPILLPTLAALNIDKIAYGVFLTIATNIAVITPPYGLLLFAGVGLFNVSFSFVAKACFMFYPALIVSMFLVAYIPQLSTFLPNLLR